MEQTETMTDVIVVPPEKHTFTLPFVMNEGELIIYEDLL
jgi:hypothetical protein